MRTTLDIDDDVFQAAKELAQHESKSAGQVLSELARKGLLCNNTHDRESQDDPFVIKDGLPVLRSRGRIVTNEMVRKLQDELEEEEARRKGAISDAHHPRYRRRRLGNRQAARQS